MSHTTCVLYVSGVSPRLADLPMSAATVVRVSTRLPVLRSLVSNFVSKHCR